MSIVLRDGPLDGKPWPTAVTDDDRRISTRVGMGETVVYIDTRELDPTTGGRIFAYRPPKPKPVDDPGDDGLEDDADDE